MPGATILSLYSCKTPQLTRGKPRVCCMLCTNGRASCYTHQTAAPLVNCKLHQEQARLPLHSPNQEHFLSVPAKGSDHFANWVMLSEPSMLWPPHACTQSRTLHRQWCSRKDKHQAKQNRSKKKKGSAYDTICSS